MLSSRWISFLPYGISLLTSILIGYIFSLVLIRDIGPQYTQTELFWFRIILTSQFVALIAITGMGIGYAIWFRDELKTRLDRL
jgi:hypothetical protein